MTSDGRGVPNDRRARLAEWVAAAAGTGDAVKNNIGIMATATASSDAVLLAVEL